MSTFNIGKLFASAFVVFRGDDFRLLHCLSCGTICGIYDVYYKLFLLVFLDVEVMLGLGIMTIAWSVLFESLVIFNVFSPDLDRRRSFL